MEDKISSFLHFGYLPQRGGTVSSFPFDVELLEGLESRWHDSDRMVDQGCSTLQRIFSDIPENDRDKHVIPLSGGLDSRVILGGLLECGQKENITTITFGTPGTYDYDIGNQVAQSVGVEHKSIDLNKIEIEKDQLLETIGGGADWTFLFDAYYNRLITREFGPDCIYWSGFMGDPLAGSHLSKKVITDFEEAKKTFVEKNTFPDVSIYKHQTFDPVAVLPDDPILEPETLSYLEQLDFSIRQTQYIRPTVMKTGYEFRTPFLDEQWIQFILSVPRQQRVGMRLYKKILQQQWPDLFAQPTETHAGLPLGAPRYQIFFRKFLSSVIPESRRFIPGLSKPPKRSTNYLNFAEAIRYRSDYKTLVKRSLSALENRNMVDWIDIQTLWKIHQNGKRDIAYPLLLLTALELNLRIETEV